jgi:glycosyltransferase involved in cell wall biosynthesis
MWGRYTSVFGKTTVFARIRRQNALPARFSFISNPLVDVRSVFDVGVFVTLAAIRNAEFVIARLPSFIGIFSIVAARALKKPYLIELVGCPFDSLWNHSAKGKLAAPPVAALTKLLVKGAPFVLYVTERYLQNRYPTRGKSISCSNVLLEDFDDALVERRRGKSLAEKHVVKLCTTGAVDVRYKGQDDVVRALAELKSRGGKAIEYHLVGGGSRRYLQGIAQRLGVGEALVFHGMLNKAQMNAVLDEMDLYIQPSRTEGLPRALIEAMNRGLPAIGSNVGGIPELLDAKMLFGGRNKVGMIRDLITGLDDVLLKAQSERNYRKSRLYDFRVIEARRECFFKEFANRKTNRENKVIPS